MIVKYANWKIWFSTFEFGGIEYRSEILSLKLIEEDML